MSDQPSVTPRTDAILPLGSASNPEVQHVAIELAGLARSLERDLSTLRELAEGLAVGLACALRQWQSYAQDDDVHDLETSGHLEGRIYRIHAKSLKDYRAACPGEGGPTVSPESA